MNIRDELGRAHRMSASDPDDPTRGTLYSRARDEIDRLTAIFDAAPHADDCHTMPGMMSSAACTCWKSKL